MRMLNGHRCPLNICFAVLHLQFACKKKFFASGVVRFLIVGMIEDEKDLSCLNGMFGLIFNRIIF